MTLTGTPEQSSDEHLKVGDTLTVVSGKLGGVWMAEDDDGVVYAVTQVE